eukprot:9783125-Lingulodinium_polyedra.AAC.1
MFGAGLPHSAEWTGTVRAVLPMVLPPTVSCGPSRHALACLISVRGASASAPEVRGSARPTFSAPSNPGSEIGRGVPTDEA